MTDLMLGVGVPAAPGADPVALAQQAERLGFDFVSLPDHPCGPHPSYEATVLTPAEKVDGLAEAIQVIRGAWTQPGYSQDGRHHTVRDLEMEPRPARPIPVWTGAFGPRSLAVTGRLADGWIPSLGYMPTEDIPAMRHRIDAAAEAAGRHPRDILGILNLGIRIDPGASPQPDLVTGPVTRVLGQLHNLLDLGFNGLSFLPAGPDRKAGMQQIAEEIIPVLRTARS